MIVRERDAGTYRFQIPEGHNCSGLSAARALLGHEVSGNDSSRTSSLPNYFQPHVVWHSGDTTCSILT